MDVGLAIVELFTVQCAGWTNCIGLENDRLTYSYYVEHNDVSARLPIYSGSNTTVNLYFPVGDPADDYRDKLRVVVENDALYDNSLSIYPVTVCYLCSHIRANPNSNLTVKVKPWYLYSAA